MREMKDSGVEWIGEIPEDWNVGKTLYALSMPITDGPHETPELFDEGIPFISAEAVSCGNGLVKVVHFTALGEPFAFFVHRPHGEQDMGVWVAVPLVMDGKVGNHAFGNKKLPAVVPDKVGVL